MGQSQAAVGLDRLPWLEDEPSVPVARGRSELLPWTIVALLLIAIASYWIIAPRWGQPDIGPVPQSPGTTTPLPEARSPAPQPQVEPAPAPEVEPVPAPTISLPPSAKPVRTHRSAQAERKRKLSPMAMSGSDLEKTVAKQEKPVAEPDKASAAPAEAPAATKPAAPAAPAPIVAAKPRPLKLWPSRQAAGASGRLVQIGAFGSRQQAKLGWRKMKRSYPAVGRLPAVVVMARNSRGRTFYRFQIGTTSQAHSEVLCQRMERIRFSCAVVGLSWKSKVER